MKSYVIFFVEEITDQQMLTAYKQKARPTVEPAGGEVIVAYARQRLVEGDPLKGVVIIEFPDYAAAEEWYESRSYQDAAAMRHQGARCQVVIVEGRLR